MCNDYHGNWVGSLRPITLDSVHGIEREVPDEHSGEKNLFHVGVNGHLQ